MAWTATVINKEFVNGFYSITVQYTDGTNVVNETYKAQVPKLTWLQGQVGSRISQLEVAGRFDISLGTITLPVPIASDPNISLFGQRIKILEVAKLLIDMGVIQATNPKVVALANWIKNNFDTYIEQVDLWR